MRYITPAVLRAAGTGLPLAGVSNTDLAGLIALAEAQIDGHLTIREDSSLGLAPGSRTEFQPWNRLTRRVYPSCFPVPVTSITSYQVVTGQNADGSLVAATVQPFQVVINNDLGYLETVSLAVVAFGLTPVVAQVTVIEPFVKYTYVAGYSIAKINWPLVFQPAVPPYGTAAWHSLLPFWDTTQAVSVIQNGSTLAPANYAVNARDGTIAISSTFAAADVVTASFTHTIPDEVTQAARMAAADAAQDYFANLGGLVGLDMIHTADQQVRRRGTFRDPGVAYWQQLLAPLKTLRAAMGMSNVT